MSGCEFCGMGIWELVWCFQVRGLEVRVLGFRDQGLEGYPMHEIDIPFNLNTFSDTQSTTVSH